MSWKEITIGDLGKVITGNTPPKNDPENYGGTYPFIKPTDMEIGQRYVNVWEETYSEKAFKRYKNAYIPPGSTGVVTIGTVGEKLFLTNKFCFTNQSVNVVIPSKDFDNKFVYYLLKVNLPKVANANPGTASGRHHVSKTNFCSIKVKVPPLPTQRKIAAILSAYDDLIENNLRRIRLLEELAQRTYEEWFVRLRFPNHETTPVDEGTGLPEGWRKTTIGKVCHVTGGGTPSKAESKYWEEGDITWFSPTDLSKANSLLLLDSSSKITELGLKKSAAKLLDSDSFMMTSRATIGLFGLIDKPFTTNQGFINVTPKNKFEKEYLLYNFMARVDEFKGVASGSTFLEISKSKFKSLEIIYPKQEVLSTFHDFTRKIHKLLNNLVTQNHLLREARDLLLPRLMTGMIDVEALGSVTKEGVGA